MDTAFQYYTMLSEEEQKMFLSELGKLNKLKPSNKSSKAKRMSRNLNLYSRTNTYYNMSSVIMCIHESFGEPDY